MIELNDDDSPELRTAKEAVNREVIASVDSATHHARRIADAHQYLAEVLRNEKGGNENG